MRIQLNTTLVKLLLTIFAIAIPNFITLEASADNHTDMSSEMEMEQNVKPESEAYDNIDNGTDGEPVVTLPEIEEEIEVIVKNNTNAAIDYQAIGFTENQTLEDGEEQTLQGLPVPVVIRAARQDDGFLMTKPMINENGVLELSLDETTERNLAVIRIEEDGGVYINEHSKVGMDSEVDSHN